MQTVLGVIGGSGIYELDQLQRAQWRDVSTPWGAPSDQILFAERSGLPLRFLPRHGRGHRLDASSINYRANIDALKRAGVTDVISVSACGSLREELVPGSLMLVDQFVDRTVARANSFFGAGLVAHVSMADPVSPLLVERIANAAAAEGIPVRRSGTYVTIEGPQFSTRAESTLYRSWNCDVIGMTNMPEARLAREAEICYATIAMVTDFDAWRAGAVSVPEMLRIMSDNVTNVHRILLHVFEHFPREHPQCPIGSDRALETALVTAPAQRDPTLVKKLDAIAGRVLCRG